MGCFVHIILLGVGCFVSLQKNVVVFVHIYQNGCGVFCPWGVLSYTLHTHMMPSWVTSQMQRKPTFDANVDGRIEGKLDSYIIPLGAIKTICS